MARVRVRHANGRWVALEAHARPLGSGGGVVIVARDITGEATLEDSTATCGEGPPRHG